MGRMPAASAIAEPSCSFRAARPQMSQLAYWPPLRSAVSEHTCRAGPLTSRRVIIRAIRVRIKILSRRPGEELTCWRSRGSCLELRSRVASGRIVVERIAIALMLTAHVVEYHAQQFRSYKSQARTSFTHQWFRRLRISHNHHTVNHSG
jgi:hypothetical protein